MAKGLIDLDGVAQCQSRKQTQTAFELANAVERSAECDELRSEVDLEVQSTLVDNVDFHFDVIAQDDFGDCLVELSSLI